MTETLIVLATAIAAFFLSDPLYGGALTKAPIAKVVVVALVFGAVLFHVVGRGLVAPQRLRRAAGEVAADWWPLIALALWIIGGSVYALYADEVKENFLSMGLGMLFLPAMALAVRSSKHALGLMQALAAVLGVLALAMLAVLLSSLHVFHEEIFAVLPLGAYFLVAPRVRLWQLVLGLALIAACLFSFKNTTFLLALTTLSACVLVWAQRFLRGRPSLQALLGAYVGSVAAVAAAVGLYVLWKEFRTELPTGNVEYRVEMYGIAWRRFLDSPVWGTLFTDSTVNYFELYRVAVRVQSLPTHSDILDLISHGGLIALALWAATVWRVLAMWWKSCVVLSQPGQDTAQRPWRWLFVLGMVQICAVVTYAVNPPLISPVHAFWVWGGIGVMWALYKSLTEAAPGRVASAAARRAPRAGAAAWRAGS